MSVEGGGGGWCCGRESDGWEGAECGTVVVVRQVRDIWYGEDGVCGIDGRIKTG